MRDSAEEAVGLAAGFSREDLDVNRMLELSPIRCVQIVGEAAAQIDAGTRESIPNLPWPQMIGMRNRLVHAYADIDLNYLWDTIQRDLPALIEELHHLLAEDSVADHE